MAKAPRPHISHALQHLRSGVYGAGGVLMVALLAQLVCWTVIHFGQPDTTRLEAPAGEGQAKVIHTLTKAELEAREQFESSTPLEEKDEPETAVAQGPSINEVPTGAGLVMRRLADVSQIVGIIASVALLVFMCQGVAVAGGGGVPGVEMVVTASTWSFVLASLAFPWAGVLPEVTFGGVLRSGEAMADGARAYANKETGAAAYFGLRVLLPFLMTGGAFACVLRFRAGVRRGIIVTHASMLDEQLEAELRKRKVGEGFTPRAVGALNTAIGEAPAEQAAPPPPTAPQASQPSPPPGSPMSTNYNEGAKPGRPI